MKRILLAIFILISFHLYSQTDNDSALYWSKNSKLKWTDFKGKIPSPDGNESARSFIEIRTRGIWKHHIPKYKIFVQFKKSDSWAKDTSTSLLDHEQLHFDIGELYARKIKNAFLKLKKQGDTVMKDYSRVLHAYYVACENCNALYDRETDHGVYHREQKKWDARIARELIVLKRYRTR